VNPPAAVGFTGTASTPSPARARLGRLGPWLLVIGGLVIIAVLAGAPRDGQGEPFDPSSTAPNGTKALVEMLESFGASVDPVSAEPSPDDDVALLFEDALGDEATAAVEDWVRAGGTLVVADPFSAYTPPVAGATGAFGVSPTLDRDRCDIDAVDDLTVLDPGESVRYEVEPGRASCFGDGTDAFAVVDERGLGRVVAVGGATIFTNARLDEADNAPFAARLLVPSTATSIAVLQAGTDPGSDRSLSEVMSLGAKLALVQLVAAFGIYAWHRARRLGAPVPENQPVDIAGSELVLAVGQLLQQTRNPGRAAALLRTDFRRRVCERLGLPIEMGADALAEVVLARTELDPEVVRRTITDVPVATDAELLELAQTVESIRQELLHER
jgi:hypothetical protein